MAEEKKEKMSDKMYGHSPKLERDEGGKVGVKREDKKEEKKEEGEEPGSGGELPVTSRHSIERMELHSKHQQEHHTHDFGKHGDKKELHARHLEELRALHKKHEKELGGKKE